jgi:hypothetical protein
MPADGALYSDEGDTWYCEYCWKTVADSHSACIKHLRNIHHYNETAQGRVERRAIIRTCEQKAQARREEQRRLEEQLRLEEQQAASGDGWLPQAFLGGWLPQAALPPYPVPPPVQWPNSVPKAAAPPPPPVSATGTVPGPPGPPAARISAATALAENGDLVLEVGALKAQLHSLTKEVADLKAQLHSLAQEVACWNASWVEHD